MQGCLGIVEEILEEHRSIQKLLVWLPAREKRVKAWHYTSASLRCAREDKVLLNTSALDLQLGTGGYGFVVANLTATENTGDDCFCFEYPGHIMKLRYTPQQTPVLATEAPESTYHQEFQGDFDLAGRPILLGELHSMLPIIASLLATWDHKRRLAYIMDDQAALFAPLSDHLRFLRDRVNLVTITYGQGLGGDIETVNLYTALEAATKVAQAEDIIITQGPGVVGTGTRRGFSGMQLAHWIHCVKSCGGEPLVIPRIQFSDARTRHLGLSHHTLEPLVKHVFTSAKIAYPVLSEDQPFTDLLLKQLELLQTRHELFPIPSDRFVGALDNALAWYGRPITTMGRTFEEEPYFFYAAAAAFSLYQEICYYEEKQRW